MIVVADTSVLLNLALVGHEGLLAALFREVLIPPPVLQALFVRARFWAADDLVREVLRLAGEAAEP